MTSRLDHLELVTRYGHPKNRIRQVLLFITFEAYYQLCELMGYRTRHFLKPLPEEVKTVRAGERILLTLPRLPLSIRLLDRIVPFGYTAHAEFAPYTPEAAAAARASGRRVGVMDVVSGEFKKVSR